LSEDEGQAREGQDREGRQESHSKGDDRRLSDRHDSPGKEDFGRSGKSGRQTSSKITPMRSPKKGQSMEVCVIKPASMEDTREIAETLMSSRTVVLNLEGVDVDLAQRIIDFTLGCCYALSGQFQKISDFVFIITPFNVDISGDYQDILGGKIPSMHTEL